jgi:tetratricopeptide (TPR) repeat protein
MNRLLTIVAALLIACPGLAFGQSTIEDVVNAHTKIKGNGNRAGTISNDLVDWSDYDRAGWRAMNKGYYDTAEHEFYSAIKTARRMSGDDPRPLARSYADYAYAIQKQGRHAEAEPLVKWALVVRESLFDADHYVIAQSQNQLATIYYELGRFSEAEPLLKRAIETQTKARKPNLQEHARSHSLLGLLLISQRRYAEAEPYFLQAIRLREKTLGTSHPEIGDAVNNLAWTYHEQGKDDEARPLFERALKIFEKSSGPMDPSVAHVLDGLGQIHAREGENEQAEAAYLRAIAIWDQRVPAGNMSLVDVLKHYADLLEKLGRGTDLVRIKARIAPLRAKFTMIEGRVGAQYRIPAHAPGLDLGTIQQRS